MNQTYSSKKTSLRREIRFWLFTELIGLSIKLLPKDATETWKWVAQMPIEK